MEYERMQAEKIGELHAFCGRPGPEDLIKFIEETHPQYKGLCIFKNGVLSSANVYVDFYFDPYHCVLQIKNFSKEYLLYRYNEQLKEIEEMPAWHEKYGVINGFGAVISDEQKKINERTLQQVPEFLNKINTQSNPNLKL